MVLILLCRELEWGVSKNRKIEEEQEQEEIEESRPAQPRVPLLEEKDEM